MKANKAGKSRRAFLKEAAGYGGVLMAAGVFADSSAVAAQGPQSNRTDLAKRVGLELFTVRDLTEKDYEGTLARVAQIGYTEVEPASNYANLEPKQFRALLDRYGLSMPSTHVAASEGPDLERQLEGFQIMGIKYAAIRAARPAGAARAGGPAPARGAAPPVPPPQTVDAVKRSAEQANKTGAILKKFGMLNHIHNHTQEFERCVGSDLRPYDVLLAETDPELVGMQIDIGWAAVAGVDVVELFKKYPGRFPLWHIKDAFGMKSLSPSLTPNQRRDACLLVPIGMGEVDYGPIFANAALAGMKYFCIEQDNGADWGDSLAAAKVNYSNLVRVLSKP